MSQSQGWRERRSVCASLSRIRPSPFQQAASCDSANISGFLFSRGQIFGDSPMLFY